MQNPSNVPPMRREPTIAWLDESGFDIAGHATVLLAAIHVPTALSAPLIRELQAIRQPGQRWLHWRDERPQRRQQVIELLATHRVTAWVASQSDLPLRQKEAARARCLHAVLELMDGAVDHVVIEGRRGGDQHDRRTIRSSRSNVQLTRFASKAVPLLWVADTVASVRAGGRCFLGGEHGYWDHELRLHEEHTRCLLG